MGSTPPHAEATADCSHRPKHLPKCRGIAIVPLPRAGARPTGRTARTPPPPPTGPRACLRSRGHAATLRTAGSSFRGRRSMPEHSLPPDPHTWMPDPAAEAVEVPGTSALLPEEDGRRTQPTPGARSHHNERPRRRPHREPHGIPASPSGDGEEEMGGGRWLAAVVGCRRPSRPSGGRRGVLRFPLDLWALFNIIYHQWSTMFSESIPRQCGNLKLMDYQWATAKL